MSNFLGIFLKWNKFEKIKNENEIKKCRNKKLK
jgi:hypothetical protein